MPELVLDERASRLAMAGELAASLAHDWNNFLAILRLLAGEIGESVPEGHPSQEAIREMRATLDLAADAPRRMLSWLRAQPGERPITGLNDAISESVSLFRLAAGSSVRCEFALDASAPSIPLDRPQFIHAALNLIANAAQAMDGKGTILIATGRQDGRVLFSVSDNGKGMTEETRSRLFEPFFTTRSGEGGSGLGMATLRRLAEDHGATIDVISAPGQGARFVIAFPGASPISNG